jgi:hypothetical protein
VKFIKDNFTKGNGCDWREYILTYRDNIMSDIYPAEVYLRDRQYINPLGYIAKPEWITELTSVDIIERSELKGYARNFQGLGNQNIKFTFKMEYPSKDVNPWDYDNTPKDNPTEFYLLVDSDNFFPEAKLGPQSPSKLIRDVDFFTQEFKLLSDSLKVKSHELRVITTKELKMNYDWDSLTVEEIKNMSPSDRVRIFTSTVKDWKSKLASYWEVISESAESDESFFNPMHMNPSDYIEHEDWSNLKFNKDSISDVKNITVDGSTLIIDFEFIVSPDNSRDLYLRVPIRSAIPFILHDDNGWLGDALSEMFIYLGIG